MAKAAPAKKPNLFAKAKDKVAEAPAKSKGTVFSLPKNLDESGKLIGESAILNNAVHEAREAKSEEDAAKNKGNLAKGRIAKWTLSEVVKTIASIGVLPPTPVSVVNHNGESVTYVMQDKSQQNALKAEQVELFQAVLGEEGAAKVIHKKTVFSFSPDVMEQSAYDPKATAAARKQNPDAMPVFSNERSVMDVIGELISNAVAGCTELTDEQKEALIESKVGMHLRPNTLPRIAELCGGDVARIEQFLDAAGSAAVRYVKVSGCRCRRCRRRSFRPS